jgi:pimeloyl-ACP methyl ester carboxylesterase
VRSSSGARRTSAGTDRALTRRSTRCRRVCLCYPWCVKQRIECSGANDVRLVADAYGDPAAPAVLLLHGGGQTRHSWGGTAKALAKEGFYAVSADLRGHGESDWDPTGDYSMAVMRADAEAWCRALHTPVLVGASMGGITGMWTEGARAEEGLPPAGACAGAGRHRASLGGRRHPADRRVHDRPARGLRLARGGRRRVAEYMPHRPRPTNTDGLARNLRLGDDGRYRWHWDPRVHEPRRRPRTSAEPGRVRRARRPAPDAGAAGAWPDERRAERGGRAGVPVRSCRRRVTSTCSDAHHMVAGDRNDSVHRCRWCRSSRRSADRSARPRVQVRTCADSGAADAGGIRRDRPTTALRGPATRSRPHRASAAAAPRR